MEFQEPYCSECWVKCEALDCDWWRCPECGTTWTSDGRPDTFNEWPNNNEFELDDIDELPPLMDGFYTIREDSNVTIVEVDNPPNSFSRFVVMIGDHKYCYSSEYLYAEQEAEELRAKIKAHYTLRKEGAEQ